MHLKSRPTVSRQYEIQILDDEIDRLVEFDSKMNDLLRSLDPAIRPINISLIEVVTIVSDSYLQEMEGNFRQLINSGINASVSRNVIAIVSDRDLQEMEGNFRRFRTEIPRQSADLLNHEDNASITIQSPLPPEISKARLKRKLEMEKKFQEIFHDTILDARQVSLQQASPPSVPKPISREVPETKLDRTREMDEQSRENLTTSPDGSIQENVGIFKRMTNSVMNVFSKSPSRPVSHEASHPLVPAPVSRPATAPPSSPPLSSPKPAVLSSLFEYHCSCPWTSRVPAPRPPFSRANPKIPRLDCFSENILEMFGQFEIIETPVPLWRTLFVDLHEIEAKFEHLVRKNESCFFQYVRCQAISLFMLLKPYPEPRRIIYTEMRNIVHQIYMDLRNDYDINFGAICGMCLRNTDKPVKIWCGHSFCTNCTSMYMKQSCMCPFCDSPLLFTF